MGKNQFKENEMGETKRRAKYTLEYKMEAVRLVKGGQAVSVTAGQRCGENWWPVVTVLARSGYAG